ncbi:hypothetical protein PF008_g1421 [Phytophthora fragariae]|uniref:Secreted protein n=1 Tax=Phytophthora fragariae TaxID=53985 RepID=A0A6G0SKE2_9STRA|nr:hypothetical protein PF008_g1421 [Phytophthora fragariae]
MLLCCMPVAVLLQRCVHCYDAALLPVVAVLLHQCRPFLSCCSATCKQQCYCSDASIALMLLC